MISEDLGFYLILKKFWQNLGISYQDIQTLPHTMFETLNDIMTIEEQFQEKEIKKKYDINNKR